MEHLEATRLLPEAAAGALPPRQARALEAHASGCLECRRWLETWELFADGGLWDETHLESDELCTFALAPGQLDPSAADRCRQHLAACPECSGEVEVVRAAVRTAEVAPLPLTGSAERPRRAGTAQRAWLALAATLALMVGGLLVASQRLAREAEDYRLVGESVEGHRSIQASHSILVEVTEVEVGSQLTLQSELVAFGDGFSIGPGAGLEVITETASDEEDSSRS